MSVDQVFRALGDPIRLEMITRLSSGDNYTINTLSSGLRITRQGARKHLRALEECELVILQPQGRDTNVILNQKRLEESKAFIAKLEVQWDMRLSALRRVVEDDPKKN